MKDPLFPCIECTHAVHGVTCILCAVSVSSGRRGRARGGASHRSGIALVAMAVGLLPWRLFDVREPTNPTSKHNVLQHTEHLRVATAPVSTATTHPVRRETASEAVTHARAACDSEQAQGAEWRKTCAIRDTAATVALAASAVVLQHHWLQEQAISKWPRQRALYKKTSRQDAGRRQAGLPNTGRIRT